MSQNGAPSLRLTKHHGLGNDFLVLLDIEGRHPVGADLVRSACDRPHSIAANGLIWATEGTYGAYVTMELFKADGGRGEMSGNGVACLAQAVVLAGLAGSERVTVDTETGMRTIEVEPTAMARTQLARVAMGPVEMGDDEPEWLDDEVIQAVRIDMGNPHLVRHVPDPEAAPDIEERGRLINDHVRGGFNVEVIRVGPGETELTMAVYGRGVGPTRSGGTGACAAAAAAKAWDLIGDRVTVNMPGGPVQVELGQEVHLTTRVTAVAAIDFYWP
ncbi:diaminopimelate epimerase [soil metagenome]